MTKRYLIATLAVFALAAVVGLATGGAAEQSSTKVRSAESLQLRVEQLERRVAELERRLGTMAAPPALHLPPVERMPRGTQQREFNGLPYYVVPLQTPNAK